MAFNGPFSSAATGNCFQCSAAGEVVAGLRSLDRKSSRDVCALRRRGEIRTFPGVSQAALPAKNQTESRPGAPVILLGFFLAGIVAVYCWLLWPEWIHNADLSHGIFTPLICLLLVSESRRAGPQRWLPDTGIWLLLPAGAVGVALSAFGLAGVLAASLGWEHALVDFLLAATVAGTLLAGLVCVAGRRTRAVPFNWISLTAAGLL